LKVEKLIEKVKRDAEELMKYEDDLFFHTYAYLKRYSKKS